MSNEEVEARIQASVAKWSLIDAGTCHVILNHHSVDLDADGAHWLADVDPLVGIHWNGPCDGRGLIAGRGTLNVDYTRSFMDYSPGFPGQEFRGIFREEFMGAAVIGRMNGRARFTGYEQETNGGPLIVSGDGYRQYNVTFDRGCMTAANGDPLTWGCEPSGGDALHEQETTARP